MVIFFNFQPFPSDKRNFSKIMEKLEVFNKLKSWIWTTQLSLHPQLVIF